MHKQDKLRITVFRRMPPNVEPSLNAEAMEHHGHRPPQPGELKFSPQPGEVLPHSEISDSEEQSDSEYELVPMRPIPVDKEQTLKLWPQELENGRTPMKQLKRMVVGAVDEEEEGDEEGPKPPTPRPSATPPAEQGFPLVDVLFFRPVSWGIGNPLSGTNADSQSLNNHALIKQHILAAEDYLDIAMYTLTDTEIFAAIVDRFNHGVNIRVIVDGPQAYRISQGKGGAAADIASSLLQLGVPVYRVNCGRFRLMHHKFVVIDGKVLLVGSYNFTGKAPRRNWENVAIVRDRGCIENYEGEFDKIWRNVNFAYREDAAILGKVVDSIAGEDEKFFAKYGLYSGRNHGPESANRAAIMSRLNEKKAGHVVSSSLLAILVPQWRESFTGVGQGFVGVARKVLGGVDVGGGSVIDTVFWPEIRKSAGGRGKRMEGASSPASSPASSADGGASPPNPPASAERATDADGFGIGGGVAASMPVDPDVLLVGDEEDEFEVPEGEETSGDLSLSSSTSEEDLDDTSPITTKPGIPFLAIKDGGGPAINTGEDQTTLNRRKLISVLQSAKKSIDFAIFQLEDKELIKDTLLDIVEQEPEIRIRIIVDQGQAVSPKGGQALLKMLPKPCPKQSHNIEIRKSFSVPSAGIFHHKFLVIDGKTVVTGSYNWSPGAALRNMENVLIIQGNELVAEKFAWEFEELWAVFAENELFVSPPFNARKGGC